MDNIKLSTGISERTHREERESSLKIWRAPLESLVNQHMNMRKLIRPGKESLKRSRHNNSQCSRRARNSFILKTTLERSPNTKSISGILRLLLELQHQFSLGIIRTVLDSAYQITEANLKGIKPLLKNNYPSTNS